MGWLRIFSVDAGVGKLLLVKCSQVLTNLKNEFSLSCFCEFLCLFDLKICFCRKRVRLWLESRIKLIDIALDHSREHWGNLITLNSFYF